MDWFDEDKQSTVYCVIPISIYPVGLIDKAIEEGCSFVIGRVCFWHWVHP